MIAGISVFSVSDKMLRVMEQTGHQQVDSSRDARWPDYLGQATPYAIFVRSAGVCPHTGEVVTPGVYLLPFLLF